MASLECFRLKVCQRRVGIHERVHRGLLWQKVWHPELYPFLEQHGCGNSRGIAGQLHALGSPVMPRAVPAAIVLIRAVWWAASAVIAIFAPPQRQCLGLLPQLPPFITIQGSSEVFTFTCLFRKSWIGFLQNARGGMVKSYKLWSWYEGWSLQPGFRKSIMARVGEATRIVFTLDSPGSQTDRWWANTVCLPNVASQTWAHTSLTEREINISVM